MRTRRATGASGGPRGGSRRIWLGADVDRPSYSVSYGCLGAFIQSDDESIPPLGIALGLAFAVLVIALRASVSLRSLLTNQRHLLRLNVWRLEGIVFLLLMHHRQMPALWALPAAIGDIAVGTTAFWVAQRLATPSGRHVAVVFNLFGLTDLMVAVGLGMMTNVGPFQIFHTVPTSELVTHFPLVVVPAFLVPLACALHVISLTQLWRGSGSLRLTRQ